MARPKFPKNVNNGERISEILFWHHSMVDNDNWHVAEPSENHLALGRIQTYVLSEYEGGCTSTPKVVGSNPS